LRLAEPAQSLDTASAQFFRLVSQMRFKRGPYLGSNGGAQPLEVIDGLRGQDNRERHSG
jgi:hypothetical protein